MITQLAIKEVVTSSRKIAMVSKSNTRARPRDGYTIRREL